MDDIKASEWYNGEDLSKSDANKQIEKRYARLAKEKKKKLEKE